MVTRFEGRRPFEMRSFSEAVCIVGMPVATLWYHQSRSYTLSNDVIGSTIMASEREVFILSTDQREIKQLCSILSEGRFGSRVFSRLDDLEADLNRSDSLAAILDVDSVPLSNRIIRILKDSFPKLNIFCTSQHRLHPELQDALSRHICACLRKPVDPDEVQFWLKSILNNEFDSKAPP